eukprot:COSAG06_NODE_12937_length_1310_cov_1.774566_1_plen_90_part_10
MNDVWYGQLIRLDPSWLLESTKHADFTTSQAAATWNRPEAIGSPEYVSTCMYFRHLGHSSGQPPGTILYLPKDWWHATANVDDCVSPHLP